MKFSEIGPLDLVWVLCVGLAANCCELENLFEALVLKILLELGFDLEKSIILCSINTFWSSTLGLTSSFSLFKFLNKFVAGNPFLFVFIGAKKHQYKYAEFDENSKVLALAKVYLT